jgi:hypothetical protein
VADESDLTDDTDDQQPVEPLQDHLAEAAEIPVDDSEFESGA